MSLSLLQCGAFLPGLNTVVVGVGVSQLKALSYFGNTRLRQTLVLWTLVLCLLRQPPFWAFQKYVFGTSLPFLSEEKRERLKTWFRSLFFLGRCMYESIVLISSSDILSFRTAPEKYDSSHVLCIFFMHWLNKSSFLINSQRVPTAVLLQQRSKAEGLGGDRECRPIQGSKSCHLMQPLNFTPRLEWLEPLER